MGNASNVLEVQRKKSVKHAWTLFRLHMVYSNVQPELLSVVESLCRYAPTMTFLRRTCMYAGVWRR